MITLALYRRVAHCALALLALLFITSHLHADIIYVAVAGDNRIEKVNSSGVDSIFVSNINGPTGMAFDSAGNLFSANANGDKTIQKITPGGAISPFATKNSVPHLPLPFQPLGLAFDSNGTLFAGDNDNSVIYKFSSTGVGTIFASTGLATPRALAFDKDNNLYVANTTNNTISKITPAGVASVFVSTGLNGPNGLAFDKNGNLFASNFNTNTIEKFTPAGVGSVFASTGLSGPVGLAFDSAGNLYAANFNSESIEKFTPSGAASLFAHTGRPQFLAFTTDAGVPLLGPSAGSGNNVPLPPALIPALASAVFLLAKAARTRQRPQHS